MLIMMLMMLILLFGLFQIFWRLAWGTTKFLFGLGLFWFCPVLFVIAVLFGAFSHLWIPILVIGLLCGRGLRTV